MIDDIFYKVYESIFFEFTDVIMIEILKKNEIYSYMANVYTAFINM